MARIVKKPEVRRAEILGVADSLFQTQGYEATSVDEIVRTAKTLAHVLSLLQIQGRCLTLWRRN